jgi:hypothetical protein
MKIEINPTALQSFRELSLPSTISISRTSVTFNNTAKKILGLENGSKFVFEFEDGQLYYKDSSKDGFVIAGIMEKMVTIQLGGIGNYIDTFFKKGITTKKFTIGEFKDGRRPLYLIS